MALEGALSGLEGEGGGPLEDFGPIAVLGGAIRVVSRVFGRAGRRKLRLPPVGPGATQFSSFTDDFQGIPAVQIVPVRAALEVEAGLRPGLLDNTIFVDSPVGSFTAQGFAIRATIERSGIPSEIIDALRNVVVTLGASGIGRALSEFEAQDALPGNAPTPVQPPANPQSFETIAGREQVGTNLQEGTIAGSRNDQLGPISTINSFPRDVTLEDLLGVEIPATAAERKKLAIAMLGRALEAIATQLLNDYLTADQVAANVSQQLQLEQLLFQIKSQAADLVTAEVLRDLRAQLPFAPAPEPEAQRVCIVECNDCKKEKCECRSDRQE